MAATFAESDLKVIGRKVVRADPNAYLWASLRIFGCFGELVMPSGLVTNCLRNPVGPVLYSEMLY